MSGCRLRTISCYRHISCDGQDEGSKVEKPTFDDVLDAARKLSGLAVKTPLLESQALNRRAGGRLLLKAECLQKTGSFKFRGAFNCISRLAPDALSRGVVAYSSGNHAQGVATAAALMQTPAVIVMPADAPRLKIERTRAAGAEVRLYDRYTESREDIAEAIRLERDATMVPPFEHRHVIAGQGTAGLELMQQARDIGADPDLVLVPCSGAGLASGIALAVKAMSSKASVHPVEPEDFDEAARSLCSGKREKLLPGGKSICDALLGQIGELTFSVGQPILSDGLTASNAEVAEAMRASFTELKLVVEPGGAIALAAALSGRLGLEGRTAVAVLSGGNVDAGLFASIITGQR